MFWIGFHWFLVGCGVQVMTLNFKWMWTLFKVLFSYQWDLLMMVKFCVDYAWIICEKQKHFADKMKCKGCRVKLKGVTKLVCNCSKFV
jgi:hypothetical protein